MKKVYASKQRSEDNFKLNNSTKIGIDKIVKQNKKTIDNLETRFLYKVYWFYVTRLSCFLKCESNTKVKSKSFRN